jgi:hypothetical protein
MTLNMIAKKYYKGNLSFFDDSKARYEDFSDTLGWELRYSEEEPLSEEAEGFYGKEFAKLFDINPLKNIMLFAEINRYRGKLLKDIDVGERIKVNQLIIDHLSQFHIKPIGYEVKTDVVVLAWYLEDVMRTFNLSENLPALIDIN